MGGDELRPRRSPYGAPEAFVAPARPEPAVARGFWRGRPAADAWLVGGHVGGPGARRTADGVWIWRAVAARYRVACLGQHRDAGARGGRRAVVGLCGILTCQFGGGRG